MTGLPDDDEAERRTSQISRIRGNPNVITITIGGNDVGFADVLEACYLEADCTRVYDTRSGDVLEERIADLARQFPPVYRAIGRASPWAKLVVVGYPRLFSEKFAQHIPDGCGALRRYSRGEVGYLNRRTRSLNAAIAGAATAAGVDFVDVTEAFDGLELRCPGDESYVNRLRFRPRLFPASFHPNAKGHERLAELVATHVTKP